MYILLTEDKKQQFQVNINYILTDKVGQYEF